MAACGEVNYTEDWSAPAHGAEPDVVTDSDEEDFDPASLDCMTVEEMYKAMEQDNAIGDHWGH